ncbi:MAG: FKBP-type peptidyl-prolyl cis-trans isomerase [Candidatus Saccharimonadales bacterium]
MMSKNNDQSSTSQTSTSQTAAQSAAPQASPLIGTKLAGFTPVASVPSLVATDIKVGTGAEAKADSTLTVSYQGALAKDGTIFDATSDGQPATFALSQVIPGWQKGIPGMKVGGIRQLLIPAAQAYAGEARTGIPANSDLVFIVTLQAVK